MTHTRDEMIEKVCAAFKDIGYKYIKDDDGDINCLISTDDLPVQLRVSVDEDPEVISLISQIPCKLPEDKRIDGAVATSIVNYRLREGCFDYNIVSGAIIFRRTIFYGDSDIGEDSLRHLINLSIFTIDKYNDKFYDIAKGRMEATDLLDDGKK